MAEIGVYEAMRTLRAVRRLKSDPIPEEVLHRVLEAATWAPTGGNRQPWRIIVVKDREQKAHLGALYAERWTGFAKMYRKLLDNMPEAARQKTEKMLNAGDHLGSHFGEAPIIAIFCFNPKEVGKRIY